MMMACRRTFSAVAPASAGKRWDENKEPDARPQTNKISSMRRDFCIGDAFAIPESAIIRSRDGVCQTYSGSIIIAILFGKAAHMANTIPRLIVRDAFGNQRE